MTEIFPEIKTPQLLLGVLSLLLSFAWLTPNHYVPWESFHADAVSAAVFCAAGICVLLTYKGHARLTLLTIAALIVASLPICQWLTGMLYFGGTALVSSAYCLGFALSLLLAQYWICAKPEEPEFFILTPIAIACVLGVGVQLYQLFDLGFLDIWVLPVMGRPSGNLAQTNQQATLLVWGIIAFIWAYHNRYLNAPVTGFVVMFLLFGIALTQSRTASIELLLVAAVFCFGNFRSNKNLRKIATVALLFYFIGLQFVMPTLMDVAGRDISYDLRTISAGDARLAIWGISIDAIMQKPWFGYGMKGITEAYFSGIEVTNRWGSYVSHSHNLFLDFIVWWGIPIGTFVSLFLLRWLWICFSRSKTAQQQLLCLMLVVMAIHAMLELPLHYAYFLLPFAFIAGCLESSLKIKPWIIIGRKTMMLLVLCASGLLAIISWDYFKIEESYRVLRFEFAKIGTPPSTDPPNTIVLNQWREAIDFSRKELEAARDPEHLEYMRQVTLVLPTPFNIVKYANALAQAGQIPAASKQLAIACAIVSKEQCLGIKKYWNFIQNTHPHLAAVKTPW